MRHVVGALRAETNHGAAIALGALSPSASCRGELRQLSNVEQLTVDQCPLKPNTTPAGARGQRVPRPAAQASLVSNSTGTSR